MFRQNFLHSDVLCLENYYDYILAGIGDSLYVYHKDGILLCNVKVFEGERLHQIYVNQNVFVKGGKQIAEVIIEGYTEGSSKYGHKVNCKILKKVKCNDWIQDILVFSNEECYVLTAHNVVKLWNFNVEERKKNFGCEEKCILYSGKLIGKRFDDLIVLAGTVFSEVVIWCPASNSDFESPVLHRLKGHNGVIFSINVDINQKVICTTSDDRTLRVWTIQTPNDLSKRGDWEKAMITLTSSVFGHTARVWKSLILKDYYISVGEDSNLCVWNKNGKLEKSILLHQSSGIRGLHYAKDFNMLLTGGEDGGITMLPYDSLLKNYSAVKMKLIEGHNPSRLKFLKKKLISITDYGLLYSVENLKILNDDKDFANYCLLEVSECKRYAALGSIMGRVLIFNMESCSIKYDGKLVDGKIFSMHYFQSKNQNKIFEDYLIICGLRGVIKVFKINFPSVMEVMNFILPESKERWSTCACVGENYFIIGDRMGSIHVYKDNISPVKSFIKIHGYLGVTSVNLFEGNIFTSGRDGTVKVFNVDEKALNYLLSYKLPMEWVWRILDYGSDKLILGFSSVYLIIYSLINREILVKFNCGGGHRSCDYRLVRDVLEFAFIKEKSIYRVEFSLKDFIQLRSGYHGKLINCVKIHDGVIVSGGEDTSLRISVMDNHRDFKNVHVLETHISSVRAICFLYLSDQEKIIVSGGGRAQIAVWNWKCDLKIFKEVETFRLKEDKGQKMSFDPETRIMCLDGISFQKCSRKMNLIAVGCSDCQIRIFSFEERLILQDVVNYTHCILKISWLKIGSYLMILSFATDGKIVFWEFDEENFKGRIFDFIRVHQSGINSVAMKVLDQNLLLLATGGDDNLLAVNIVKIDRKIEVLRSWKSTNVHSCQITGILLTDEYLLSTSIDQRLTVWRYDAKKSEISMEFIGQYLTPVPDIQGMEFYNIAQGKLSICVYGKGIEMINVDLPTT